MKKVINFKEKFNQFDELWSPKIISEMNNYEFKLVKVKDDFVWHKHDDTDEVFIVIEGKLYIELLEETVEIEAGEMYVVPSGVKHTLGFHPQSQFYNIGRKHFVVVGKIISSVGIVSSSIG